MTIARDECVDVDELFDAAGNAVRDTGYYHAAIAMPDKDHVAEILALEQTDDVLDVQVKVDADLDQVRAIA